ncbi:MAG: oxygen-independent coproporphyrinogen III oxidase [Pseudomonadota bacterium]
MRCEPPARRDVSHLLSMAVPRYTSYPTAPHFSDAVGEREYRAWLGALPLDHPVSLYLHVPFCRQLCWYCGCNMKLAARYAPVAAYVETLLAEIDLLADALSGRMSVSHLHWGGGTPTALEPDDLERVMARVSERFDLLHAAEVAIEGDPRTLTREMIERIGTLGFNRVSFGVQEFDPAVQRAINRVQPAEMVAECVAALRGAGIPGINFDLIYGLPKQSVATLERTVEQCLAMTPDRVALFGYAHVPWVAKKQRLIDEASLPGSAQRLAQAEAASAAFIAGGFEQIGIDHFAAPGDPMAVAHRAGTLRRNFQGYTTDGATTLLGLGASSIGRTPSGYAQNRTETGAYARDVESGRLPVGKGIALTADDRRRARVIEAIMCYGRVDLGTGDGPPHWWRDALPALDDLAKDGVALLTGQVVTVPEEHRALRRVVAAAFDRYRAQSAVRHSVAV